VAKSGNAKRQSDQLLRLAGAPSTVVITVRPRRAIQDRAHDFEAAIDRRPSVPQKRFQRTVMNSIRLDASEIWKRQANVPSEDINPSLVLRPGEVLDNANLKSKVVGAW